MLWLVCGVIGGVGCLVGALASPVLDHCGGGFEGMKRQMSKSLSFQVAAESLKNEPLASAIEEGES